MADPVTVTLHDGTVLTGEAAIAWHRQQAQREMASRRWQQVEALGRVVAGIASQVTGGLPVPRAALQLTGNRHDAMLLLDLCGIPHPREWALEIQQARDDRAAVQGQADLMWSGDPWHHPLVIQASGEGTKEVLAALMSVASDTRIHPSARELAGRMAELARDRGMSPLDAHDEALAERERPGGPEPGVRAPGLARELDHPNPRERAAAIASRSMGVPADENGAPLQTSRPWPGERPEPGGDGVPDFIRARGSAPGIRPEVRTSA